jgi:hypothetical protein
MYMTSNHQLDKIEYMDNQKDLERCTILKKTDLAVDLQMSKGKTQ